VTRRRRRAGRDGADDPLAYMTTDSPSSYLFESRMAMLNLFFSRGRRATGWRRVVSLVMRVAMAVLLAWIAIGVVYSAVGFFRAN
jgi:hypothetical protein